MSNVQVREVSLDRVVSAVQRIEGITQGIKTEVAELQSTQSALTSVLSTLMTEFRTFVALDTKAKALALSETRLVKVRQQLETEYGHHAEVRRAALGFLQAVDRGLVAEESLQSVFEEMLLKAEGYWLAAALAALGAWVRNDHVMADRALRVSIERDALKTGLLLTLVKHRLGRDKAAVSWLKYFMRLQQPAELSREFVILLDATAYDVFGPEARVETANLMDEWIAELAGGRDFVENQTRRWRSIVEAQTPTVDEAPFAVLRAAARNWGAWKSVLAGAQMFAPFGAAILHVLAQVGGVPASLDARIDGLLRTLMSEFDTPELPMRSEERRLQLIVDCDGDEPRAAARFEPEKTSLFRERISFIELLTNAAMFGTESSATPATQRFAIAKSKDWILQGFDRALSALQARIPASFQLHFASLDLETRDGGNHSDLSSTLESTMNADKMRRVAEVKASSGMIGLLSVGAVVAVAGIPTSLPLLVILGVALMIVGVVQISGLGKVRARVANECDLAASEARSQLAKACQQAGTAQSALAEALRATAEMRARLDAIRIDDYVLAQKTPARVAIERAS